MHNLISIKNLILIIIIFFGAFLRLYKLNEFPVQLNHDEVSQLYDAISIAQTGRDIYGNFLPFIFPSVNDFKPPFYTYITTLFYFVFGGGELTIRLPAALFGVLLIGAVYLFVLKLLKNDNIALIASFFTAIAPFEIFFSRKSFENGAGIFLMLLGFLSLLNSIQKNRMLWLYMAIIFLSTAMYTYFSHAVIIPLLFLSFLFIFRDDFIFSFKKLFLPTIFMSLLLLPLFLLILTNAGARYRSQTVLITQDPNLGKQLDFSPLKFKTIFDYSLTRYLAQFDPAYLFADGLDLTNHEIIGIGPLLLVQLPLVLMGSVYLIRRSGNRKQKRFIMSWILLGMLPSALTFEEHSPHRIIMVFTMFNIIAACGLYNFATLINRLKNKFFYLKIGTAFIVMFAIVLNFAYFIRMYFINYPFEKSQAIHYPFKNVAQFSWSQYDNFDTIIFDPQFGDVAPQIGTGAHYYLAFYGNYSPSKFQKQYRLGDKPREIIFDKFSIRQVYYPDDKSLKNTLLIVSPWSVPEDQVDKSRIIKRFNFYNGQPAFYAIKL